MTTSMKVYAAAVGSVAVAMCALGLAMGGCSSSSASNTGSSSGASTSASTGSSGASTGTNMSSGAPGGACAAANANALTIAFAPMYSAVIPGSTAQTFAVPAIVSGVSSGSITWSASCGSAPCGCATGSCTASDAVELAADESTGGILITMNPSYSGWGAAGSITAVTMMANAGGVLCGSSTLNVTVSTEANWQAGSARYNDMIALASMMGAPPPTPDGGFRYACTDCHTPKVPGVDAGFSPFNDVAHTPEQTGGFSDSDLLDIVQEGVVPGYSDAGAAGANAGYFDPSILPYEAWHRIHHWNLEGAEVAGIVTYLRSLTPAAQDGTSNFGGYGGGPPPDGGYHFHHHDGGFGGVGTDSGMP